MLPKIPTKIEHTLKEIQTSTITTSVDIIDSGSSHNISFDITLFENVVISKINKYETPCVTLGNASTKLQIKGYRYMTYTIFNTSIWKMGYYTPNVSVTLISIKQYIKYQGCYFHSGDNECVLVFPYYILFTNMDNEIILLVLPSKDSKESYKFDQDTVKLFSTKNTTTLDRRYSFLSIVIRGYVSL